jgi:hypothetical protein
MLVWTMMSHRMRLTQITMQVIDDFYSFKKSSFSIPIYYIKALTFICKELNEQLYNETIFFGISR